MTGELVEAFGADTLRCSVVVDAGRGVSGRIGVSGGWDVDDAAGTMGDPCAPVLFEEAVSPLTA